MPATLLRALFVISVACASPAIAQTAAFAGCYALSLEPWNPSIGAAVREYDVPLSIRLDTLRRGPGWSLTPNIDYFRNRPFQDMPRWSAVADTVVLMWSDGFTPTVVRLVRVGDVLIGEAVALEDARPIPEPPRPRAVARARRMSCQD